MLVACTIVARNYLPYARVFARSLRAVHPRSRVAVLVIDGPADPSDDDGFRTLSLADVVPDATERDRLTFIYDVTELSTAVKPLLLRRLLDDGADAVLYFDPDIQVFDSVEGLAQVARQHGIALVPHVVSPIPDDGLGISELEVLRAGVYNLGFIGVGRNTDAFLAWWWSRLRRHCISAPEQGLFVDQRWMDYVPGLFDHAIVRDPGCDVAYWNLHERRISQSSAGTYEINGLPLRFFHFSGFDPATQYLLSRHQGPNPRIVLSENPVLRELCEQYAAQLRASGHVPVPAPYKYATLPGGGRIDMAMRRAYREGLMAAERAGTALPPLPSNEGALMEWLAAPSAEAPRISRYLYMLYRLRIDLQRAFPSPHGESAERYLHWAAADPTANATLPRVLLRRPAEPEPPPVPAEAGLNIAGYLRAELGVGEVARLVASAASAEGIPVNTILNDRTLSRQQSPFEVGGSAKAYGMTVICTNADEFPRAVDALPRAVLTDRHRVGFWFWETEEIPGWYALPAAELLDEIWAASEYVAEAIRRVVPRPVHVCPLPVRVPQPSSASRAALGVPEGFAFLFCFDFLSVVQRKNPIGLIEAFMRAFAPGEGPTLILKSINGNLARAALDTVRAAARDRSDIVIMDGYLQARDRDALIQHCDCYVSLHRSEGFGLTLAEAMMLGRPTIATGYSGNMAFMTAENSYLVPWTPALVPGDAPPYPPGHRWAEPDLDAAAALMRTVYDNPVLARERGEHARRDILERLAPARTAAFLRERMDEAARRREPAPVPAPSPEIATVIEELHAAERETDEAEQLLVSGITYETPSRFGWPGRVLRTAVMRLLRPYAQFETSVHHRHLRATTQLLQLLRARETRGGDGPTAPS
jgi:glycosyltransferase involved in cell wall biosynthesis